MSLPASTATSPFADLQPAAVWAHFAALCRIPRASKQEGPLREHLLRWAQEKGLAAQVDAAGNLILRKAARGGRERDAGVILQAHLDMVCQKNSGTSHDFTRDPIRAIRRDGYVLAEETTLGADNGIGVALILAALEDETLAHGPLEALLTVDEEAGMGGAQGLERGLLQGRYLLNLDSETWGEFYLGCAGGMDVNAHRAAADEPLPAGWLAMRIEVAGLRGGHSGIDIHSGRGNAIKLLVRLLHDLQSRFALRLTSLVGGSARNALPREAAALIALAPAHLDALAAAVHEWEQIFRAELQGIDEGLRLACTPAVAEHVMRAAEQQVWLNSLHAAPHGVKAMSASLPSTVETSNNLGMVDLQPTHGSCNFMVRSSRDSASDALADEILSLFALSATAAHKSGQYPGWTPRPHSALLQCCQAVFERTFGSTAASQVIHAGLECGLIGAKYPQLEIISFGPTIHSPHAPGEAVEIASVGKTWELLKAILAALN